jgi:iron complex transport system ATP-binding protein
MTPALTAEEISHAYEPRTPVVRGVSFALAAGRFSVVVGPNGSGKSTLLRVLAGLLAPTAGRVLLDGAPLRALGAAARARAVGFLPQSVQPAFSFNAFEVVCLGRYPHAGPFGGMSAEDLAVARAALARTGTAPLAARAFNTLSGGERQRVLLASVLAQQPRFLLLDEPTAALDLHHAQEVFAQLRSLADEGYGVAVVTHDLNLAAQYCDDTLLLGETHDAVAQGAPARVFTEAHLGRAYGARMRVGRHPFADTPFVSAIGRDAAP